MYHNFIPGNSKIITMNRGDSLAYPIFINQGSKIRPIRYYIKPCDRLYVGIMEPNQYFENAIIKKVYDFNSEKNLEGDVIFKLDPQDTEYLKSGLYYYQIKLVRLSMDGSNDFVSTIVDKTKFYIVD